LREYSSRVSLGASSDNTSLPLGQSQRAPLLIRATQWCVYVMWLAEEQQRKPHLYTSRSYPASSSGRSSIIGSHQHGQPMPSFASLLLLTVTARLESVCTPLELGTAKFVPRTAWQLQGLHKDPMPIDNILSYPCRRVQLKTAPVKHAMWLWRCGKV
jgi:hypothetical protein